jgi:hypothetical protein
MVIGIAGVACDRDGFAAQRGISRDRHGRIPVDNSCCNHVQKGNMETANSVDSLSFFGRA